MSPEERRAYARGYSARGRRRDNHLRRLWAIIRGYKARLTDTASKRRCDACARWRRGSPTTKWGICPLNFEWIEEGGAWADQPANARPWQKFDLVTHDSFGCTNWLPKYPRDAALREPRS